MSLSENMHKGEESDIRKVKNMKVPKIDLVICNSRASNTGELTGAAATEIIREYNDVGILSLPALANGVARQVAMAKEISHIIVIDGCKNSCAKKIADRLGLKYDACLNLGDDLGIRKIGPFSTLRCSDSEVIKVKDAIKKLIEKIKGNSHTEGEK